MLSPVIRMSACPPSGSDLPSKSSPGSNRDLIGAFLQPGKMSSHLVCRESGVKAFGVSSARRHRLIYRHP